MASFRTPLPADDFAVFEAQRPASSAYAPRNLALIPSKIPGGNPAKLGDQDRGDVEEGRGQWSVSDALEALSKITSDSDNDVRTAYNIIIAEISKLEPLAQAYASAHIAVIPECPVHMKDVLEQVTTLICYVWDKEGKARAFIADALQLINDQPIFAYAIVAVALTATLHHEWMQIVMMLRVHGFDHSNITEGKLVKLFS